MLEERLRNLFSLYTQEIFINLVKIRSSFSFTENINHKLFIYVSIFLKLKVQWKTYIPISSEVSKLLTFPVPKTVKDFLLSLKVFLIKKVINH